MPSPDMDRCVSMHWYQLNFKVLTGGLFAEHKGRWLLVASTRSSGRCPSSWQEGWNKIIFKVPSSPIRSITRVSLSSHRTDRRCAADHRRVKGRVLNKKSSQIPSLLGFKINYYDFKWQILFSRQTTQIWKRRLICPKHETPRSCLQLLSQ